MLRASINALESHRPRLTKGIILAGGKSSRFGEDKALAKIEGLTLLERSVRLLRELKCDPIVITNQTRDYAFLNCPVERDLIPDKGPLGGLYTACQMFKEAPLLVLTCDMPSLTPQVLRELLESHEEKNKVTIFHNPKKSVQPFPGIYEPSLSPLILDQIRQRRFSMQEFLSALPEIRIIPIKEGPEIFLNVNEKKDFQSLEAKKR